MTPDLERARKRADRTTDVEKQSIGVVATLILGFVLFMAYVISIEFGVNVFVGLGYVIGAAVAVLVAIVAAIIVLKHLGTVVLILTVLIRDLLDEVRSKLDRWSER